MDHLKFPGYMFIIAWCEMQDCISRENKSPVTKTPKVKRENLLHRGAAFALTKTNDGNKARRFPSLPCRAMRHTIYSEKGGPVEKARFWINHYRRTRCYRINAFREITVT